jgi:hypothetical protein
MLRKFITTTVAAAIAVSGLSFATITTLALSTEMAFAENENGNNRNNNDNGNSRSNNDNGNSNSNSNNNGGNGNGKTASALGALNAAHANQNALDNAAPNSRVGMIATYQREAILSTKLTAEAAAALATFVELDSAAPDYTSDEVQLKIDDVEKLLAAAVPPLDTTDLNSELDELKAELGAALEYESDYAEAKASSDLAAEVAAAQEINEADALESSANKDVPTGSVLDALRVMLGLN